MPLIIINIYLPLFSAPEGFGRDGFENGDTASEGGQNLDHCYVKVHSNINHVNIKNPNYQPCPATVGKKSVHIPHPFPLPTYHEQIPRAYPVSAPNPVDPVLVSVKTPVKRDVPVHIKKPVCTCPEAILRSREQTCTHT